MEVDRPLKVELQGLKMVKDKIPNISGNWIYTSLESLFIINITVGPNQ